MDVGVVPSISDVCDEIAVRLRIPSTSYRGWSIPIVVVLCMLIPITIGRCSPRGSVGMLADKVLLGRNRGNDDLGAQQHRDQTQAVLQACPI